MPNSFKSVRSSAAAEQSQLSFEPLFVNPQQQSIGSPRPNQFSLRTTKENEKVSGAAVSGIPNINSSARRKGKKPPVIQPAAQSARERKTAFAEDVGFLRLAEVKSITGLGKTTIYALIKLHSFPAPIRVSAHAVGWSKAEVKRWAAERVRASRTAA